MTVCAKYLALLIAMALVVDRSTDCSGDDLRKDSKSSETKEFREDFSQFDASRFETKIPNEHTELRDGLLWTHGSEEGAYPPIVALPISGHDLEVSFRYRHLEPGGWVWFLIDGDDGFGSVDHILRVKLMRDSVQLQVDDHSLDPDHPLRQKWNRDADPVSGAYRLNEELPPVKVDLSKNEWHTVKIVIRGKSADVSVDGEKHRLETLKRPCFNVAKHKVLWLLKSGDKGIEMDDLVVRPLNERLPASP